MSIIVSLTVSYICIHVVFYLVTFGLIARSNLTDGASIFSRKFFNELRSTFTKRSSLAGYSLLHFIDVGFDYGVMFGWYLEQNEFREIISYRGSLLIFMMVLHFISKITSTIYIYGVTRELLPTILQFLDLEIYYEIYFDQNITKMDLKIEQLCRSFAVMQSFPMSIIQTYLLTAYELVDAGQMLDSTDFVYITFTLLSLSSSLFFILSLQIGHDSLFMEMRLKYMSCGMHKWLIRVLFRTTELLSRVLLLCYIWMLYGILSVVSILFCEWFFQLYNHYRKQRYNHSSDNSIRMWRKQNKLFLWPIVMDELISFWNFDWKISASNPPKQRSKDPIDILQCWSLASLIYGNKRVRKSMRERPPCDCSKPMDEYWGMGLEPLFFQSQQQQKLAEEQLQMELELARVDRKRKRSTTRSHSVSGYNQYNDNNNNNNNNTNNNRLSVASNTNINNKYDLKLRASAKPSCASCGKDVRVNSHYFRCPTFLQSGTIDDTVVKEKITKHGRYLCIDCGYARMTYIPSLFVISRHIFCLFYTVIMTVFSVMDVKCSILCIDDGALNNLFHETAYKSQLFLFGIICHLLTPIFFTLILTTRQMKLRAIEAKSFSGKVVRAARIFNWSKVYELIRHEDCDVNEVDRQGRSALIYAAISHNFQCVRDLQQFGANMNHVDVNAMGIRHYFDNTKQANNETLLDLNSDRGRKQSIDYGDLKLTGATRAAKNGKAQDLYLCIELGCNLNKMDGYQHTPLLIACKEREIEILQILIAECNRNTIDINKTDGVGRTATIIATQYGYDDVLRILLRKAKKIDVDHKDQEGKTALDHAFAGNQKKCAKLLYDYNEERKKKTQEMMTNISTTTNDDDQLADVQIIQKAQETKPHEAIAINEEEEEEESGIKGDVIHHPVKHDEMLASPNMADEIPLSPIKLHESDSIDRRIYRAMTVEQLQAKEEEKEEKETEDSLQEQQIKAPIIVITSADDDTNHATRDENGLKVLEMD